jgi:hypothetical protein
LRRVVSLTLLRQLLLPLQLALLVLQDAHVALQRLDAPPQLRCFFELAPELLRRGARLIAQTPHLGVEVHARLLNVAVRAAPNTVDISAPIAQFLFLPRLLRRALASGLNRRTGRRVCGSERRLEGRLTAGVVVRRCGCGGVCCLLLLVVHVVHDCVRGGAERPLQPQVDGTDSWLGCRLHAAVAATASDGHNNLVP